MHLRSGLPSVVVCLVVVACMVSCSEADRRAATTIEERDGRRWLWAGTLSGVRL